MSAYPGAMLTDLQFCMFVLTSLFDIEGRPSHQQQSSVTSSSTTSVDVHHAVPADKPTCNLLQVVEGLAIKEGDLLEFELTQERALRVTVMKSSTVTRKPKKLAVPELQASMAKKKTYRGGIHPGMMIPGQEAVAMSDLLLPAAAAAAAQGLPIRLPDVNATQVHQLCPSLCFPCCVSNGQLPKYVRQAVNML